jgi:hypothetical protein
MIVNLNTSDDDSEVDLIANSIYSYECVRSAAQAVFDRDGSWKALDSRQLSLKQIQLGHF